MISLAQLNRHIDDAHDPESSVNSGPSSSGSTKKTAKTANTAPYKRSLKMDLHGNNSRFSLSENGDFLDGREAPKLSRAHWKHVLPQKTAVCADQSCQNTLNVRNGVVNCRKCGNLFCNEHTRAYARLSNGSRDSGVKNPLPVYDSVHGIMAKVCGRCFRAKPSVKMGTQVKSIDLTTKFQNLRQKHVETRLLAQGTVHTRFLKLAELHSQKYLWHVRQGNILALFWGSFSGNMPYTKERVLAAEKEIVGLDNWQLDEDASHCKICFVKFGILVRKHHCRLCGSVVNDGAISGSGPAQFCSAQVPMGLLLLKLPLLNYAPVVKTNWNTLVSMERDSSDNSTHTATSTIDTLFSIRVCTPCKNLLLHKSLADTKSESRDVAAVLDAYDQILAVKATIGHFLTRYHELVAAQMDTQNQQTNRVRVRLRKAAKDLENLVNAFMNRFFAVDPVLHRLAPLHNPRLVTNIYKALTAYLQESILELKRLNDEFQDAEHQKLAGQLGVSLPVPTEGTPQSISLVSATVLPTQTPPRLTKRQIRELREQLMVTNEQRFLIEGFIEDVKRQRKFDELATLEENKKELTKKINELTDELGEFGF